MQSQIASLRNRQIVLENVKFWPALLENLAEAFGEDHSVLTKIGLNSDNSVTVEGITIKLLQVHEIAQSIAQDQKLNVVIVNKSLKKDSDKDADMWTFTLKLARQQ